MLYLYGKDGNKKMIPLFRGKLKHDCPDLLKRKDDFVCGYYVGLNNNDPVKPKCKHFIYVPLMGDWNMSSLVNCEVYESSLQQYIGKTDINGEMIFEGDTLKSEYAHDMKVIYHDYGWCVNYQDMNEDIVERISDELFDNYALTVRR
jgi:hypothetical protein